MRPSETSNLPRDNDPFRREAVERARAMTDEQKLRAGGELFDYACWITKAGIRSQNPGADEAKVLELLRQRLGLRERREKRA